MAAEVAKPFNDDELLSDKISKKDIVTFLQENSSSQVSGICSELIAIFTFKYYSATCFSLVLGSVCMVWLKST